MGFCVSKESFPLTEGDRVVILREIEKIRMFQSFDINEKKRLCDMFTVQSFSKGSELVLQDQHGHHLFILKEGAAKVLVNGLSVEKIRLLSVSEINPESQLRAFANKQLETAYFGESCLVSGSPSPSSILATEDSVCYILNKEEYFKAIANLMVSQYKEK